MKKPANIQCPCQSQQPYILCCQPYHLGTRKAPTAEILMRSRYSAYALNLMDYIKDTWHPSTCPSDLNTTNTSTQWIKLIIKKTWDSKQTNEAFVEFEARYKTNGKAEKINETSRFVYENGQWLYIDGELFTYLKQSLT